MRRLRIRTRLVLGTAVLAAIVLTTALLIARAEIARLTYQSAVELATDDLNPFAINLQRNFSGQPDTVSNGLLIVIRDPSGAVARDTAPHDVRLALPAVADGSSFTFSDDEGRSYVVVSQVVTTAQGAWSLWAARDVSSNRSAVAGIDLVFVLTGAGLLLLMVVLSWLLVRGSLRPVEVLRRHAEELRDDELLPVSGNGDELARLAATLNDSVSRVRESADREKRMVSDAAHELRTPLAALAAELELLRRHRDDPEALATGLESARRGVERLTALATNLLELSRLDEPTDATTAQSGADVAADLLDAVDRARVAVAGVAVEIEDDVRIADGDARYRLAPLAVSRVADNLLSNAIKAVDGAGRIVLSAEDAGAHLVLRVGDDGPGTPEDFLPSAFERFSRADTARRSEGSGLGLALVAGIAHAAGGVARAENRHPGFAVELRLPKM